MGEAHTLSRWTSRSQGTRDLRALSGYASTETAYDRMHTSQCGTAMCSQAHRIFTRASDVLQQHRMWHSICHLGPITLPPLCPILDFSQCSGDWMPSVWW